MKHWHNTLLLFFTFQILTEVVLFILFPVFGLRKVWNLPISVHLTLSKMSPYIHWFKENKDLSFKCFMTALFRGKHLPRTQIPLGIRCAGSGTGFFMWTSFPNSFLIICTQGANTVCIWQKQAFGTGETGTALIYQPQHSSTLFNCCILQTNGTQIACGFLQFPKDLVKSSLLIFPFKSFRFLLFEKPKQ